MAYNKNLNDLNTLRNQTLEKVRNNNSDFNKFFSFVARVKNFGLSNSLLAYAQSPNANLLLKHDTWTDTYGRVPYKRSSIRLFSFEKANGYECFFDYSKTAKIKNSTKNFKPISFFGYKDTPEVVQALKVMYNQENNSSQDIYEILKAGITSKLQQAESRPALDETNLNTVAYMLASRFNNSIGDVELLTSPMSNDEFRERFINIRSIFIEEYKYMYGKLSETLIEQQESKDKVDTLSTNEELLTKERIPTVETNYSTNLLQPEKILSNDDLANVLKVGLGTLYSKFKIYDYFSKEHTDIEKTNFLKDFLRNTTLIYPINSDDIQLHYNANGIEISNLPNGKAIFVPYAELSKFFTERIIDRDFLTPNEQAKYLEYFAEEVLDISPKDYDIVISYNEQDAVTVDSRDYFINQITDDSVIISNPSEPLFARRIPKEDFKPLLLANIYNNRHLITGIPKTQPTKEKINEVAEKYGNNAEIIIEYSEHPALYEMTNKPLSLSYANELIDTIDKVENVKRDNPNEGYYYKTSFIVKTTIDGENIYTNKFRYDIADNEGGIVNFIGSYHSEDDEYNHFAEKLKNIAKNTPLSDDEIREIKEIAYADYGLDDYDEIIQSEPRDDVWGNLVGKKLVFDGSIYTIDRVDEVSMLAFLRDENNNLPDKEENLRFIRNLVKQEEINGFISNAKNYAPSKENIKLSLFSVGDFYEIYGNEAEIASELLDIHLLSKSGQPMTGFPKFAFDEYNSKLNELGYELVEGTIASTQIQSSNNEVAETTTITDDSVANSEAENYSIDNNHIGEGTPTQRYDNNINAIKLLKELEEYGRNATSEEQETLSKYVGWGGLSDAFIDGCERQKELEELLTQTEYENARASVNTAFYTPPVVIKSIYKKLADMGFTNGSILDPACGTGNFFGLLPEFMNKSKLYGVELDSLTGRIAKKLYPNANIQVKGFEKTNIQNNYIDVAVGNVPFGNFSVFDPEYNKLRLKIHDYFFVKTLDKVRPGGIVAFVTSKGTLDKKDNSVRKLLSEKAELLGAVRLPNDTFKRAANTEVVSDILFLQKRTTPISLAEYPEWVDVGTNNDGIEINNYFISHPEMICGNLEMTTSQFGLDSTVTSDGTSLQSKLDTALENISAEYKPYSVEVEESENLIEADEKARNYSFFVGNDDRIYYRENGIMTESKYSGLKAERIRGMVSIVDHTRKLIDLQVNNAKQDEIESIRAVLNQVYDNFVKKYGVISSKANNIFRDDNSYPLLQSLENIKDNGNKKEPIVEKADIFFRNTITPNIEVKSADTNYDALILSMANRGRVDIEYMSELTKNSEEDIINELNGTDIFFEPDKNEYVTADEYLSGNVKRKLRSARNYGDKANINALEAVIPEDIPASEISANLGTTWIPVEYYKQFMVEKFNMGYITSKEVKIEYLDQASRYTIKNKRYDKFSVASVNKYGIPEYNAYQVFEDCLNLKVSKVYDTYTNADGTTDRILNKKKSIIVQSKQDLLKSEFKDWIFDSPERRRDLTRLYNDRFNCIVPRKYDGSNLTFPGINPNIQLREHQINAVARMLYGGNTLLAHCVGAGKTFEMIAGAMKLKQLGLVHKSLIIVPKHLTEQTGAEFLKLYPAANILVADEKDFSPKNRKRFCTRIATNNYDAIIIGHTQFEKIPLSAEAQANILQEQLDDIMTGLRIASEEKMERITVKGLESQRKKIEKKLAELESRSIKDDVITFEELGVDQIFVDEAHYFKNLYIQTKMSNVAGVGGGTESGRASDLYAKTIYLNSINPGHGVVFATGTPISNSMSEMFTLQRYLAKDSMNEMNIYNFDNWASAFGEAVTSLELAPEGNSYRAKTRFSKFNNVPELITQFKEFADVQTLETLKLPVPDVEREIIQVEPTKEQRMMIIELGERAENIRSGGIDPREDNMLKITSDGRKLALDPRIANSDYKAGKKVKSCAEKVFDIWQQTDYQTQIIFCDLSTPKSKKSETNKEYCVYDDLKSMLVSKGIPEEQIEFIQHHQSATSKEKLFDDIRNSKVRVIIGSTAMMGTGTNIQDNAIALHHLDCPYRPADLEQREGRIIRQGNKNKTVKIFNYVTKGTFDAYMYQTVERKQGFISSIIIAKQVTERSADDIDEVTLTYGQIKAIASGNPLVAKKFEIDSELSKLSAVRNSYIDEHRKMEDEVQIELPSKIHNLEVFEKNIEKDIELIKNNPETEDFKIEIDGKLYESRTDAMKAIEACVPKIQGNNLLECGNYRGFKLYIYNTIYSEYSDLLAGMTVKGTVGYALDLHKNNATGNTVRINNILEKRIPEKHKKVLDELAVLKERLENVKIEMSKPFPQEQKYQELLKEKVRIDTQLTNETREDKTMEKEKEMSTADKMRLRDTDADGRPDFIDSDGYTKPVSPDRYKRLSEEEYQNLISVDSRYSEQCKPSEKGGYIIKYSANQQADIYNNISNTSNSKCNSI